MSLDGDFCILYRSQALNMDALILELNFGSQNGETEFSR